MTPCVVGAKGRLVCHVEQDDKGAAAPRRNRMESDKPCETDEFRHVVCADRSADTFRDRSYRAASKRRFPCGRWSRTIRAPISGSEPTAWPGAYCSSTISTPT